jgi:putative MATE family efflux protein
MKDFTVGNIPKMMFAFLVPLLLSNTLQAFYILIDAMWAGRLVGSAGVAIIATGMPVIFFLSSFLGGIVVGSSILAGQAFGSHNRGMLSDIISSSAIGAVALSVFISILGILFSGPLLRLINTPAPIFHQARVFLILIIAGMTLSTLTQWFSAMMNATGDSRTPFNILLVSLVLNAVLAPCLITGARILPPLGIAGSALSTIIANTAAAVICFFVWRSHHLSEIAPFRLRVHWDTLRTIVAVGFPLALQMLIVSSSFLFILSLVNRFGTNVTAAFGIGSRVDQFALLASFAVTAAVSAMTAQNVGAGKLERIAEITRWGVLFSLGLSLLFSGAVMLFPDAIASLFTRDRDVVLLTRHYFRIVGISYLALAVSFSLQGVLRGAGDTFGSFLIIACSMIFIRIPLCYLLAERTPLHEAGLWTGITITAFAGMVAFYLYYASGRWKKSGTRVTAPVVESSIEVGYYPVD